MHQYMVFVEVPSTAPLYSEYGIGTSCKVRVVGTIKSNNSHNACSKVSKRLDIPYDKLKAVLYEESSDGKWYLEHFMSQDADSMN